MSLAPHFLFCSTCFPPESSSPQENQQRLLLFLRSWAGPRADMASAADEAAQWACRQAWPLPTSSSPQFGKLPPLCSAFSSHPPLPLSAPLNFRFPLSFPLPLAEGHGVIRSWPWWPQALDCFLLSCDFPKGPSLRSTIGASHPHTLGTPSWAFRGGWKGNCVFLYASPRDNPSPDILLPPTPDSLGLSSFYKWQN